LPDYQGNIYDLKGFASTFLRYLLKEKEFVAAERFSEMTCRPNRKTDHLFQFLLQDKSDSVSFADGNAKFGSMWQFEFCIRDLRAIDLHCTAVHKATGFSQRFDPAKGFDDGEDAGFVAHFDGFQLRLTDPGKKRFRLFLASSSLVFSVNDSRHQVCQGDLRLVHCVGLSVRAEFLDSIEG
jgi:hypothetical protein